MKVNLRKTCLSYQSVYALFGLCGFWAVILCGRDATQDELYRAALLILVAMVFDTIDGRVAG